eukprot:2157254-Amphidinium_carterae.1
MDPTFLPEIYISARWHHLFGNMFEIISFATVVGTPSEQCYLRCPPISLVVSIGDVNSLFGKSVHTTLLLQRAVL